LLDRVFGKLLLGPLGYGGLEPVDEFFEVVCRKLRVGIDSSTAPPR
jgi:hypothetical protein